MFPELLAQVPPSRPAALTPAERQKRRREKKRQLKDAHGLREVSLLQSERQALAEALQLLDLVSDTATTPESRHALRQKLMPGVAWSCSDDDVVAKSWRNCGEPSPGRLHEDELPLEFSLQLSRFDLGLLWCAVDVMETVRSDLNHRDSPLVWNSLQRIFKDLPGFGIDWMNQLGCDRAVLVRDKDRLAQEKRGWVAYKNERVMTEQLSADLVTARAEVRRLQEALQQIAQEVSGGAAGAPAPSKIEAKLREEISGLREWNALEVAERAKAFDAVAVLQARLKKAGLPSDYRRQPGE